MTIDTKTDRDDTLHRLSLMRLRIFSRLSSDISSYSSIFSGERIVDRDSRVSPLTTSYFSMGGVVDWTLGKSIIQTTHPPTRVYERVPIVGRSRQLQAYGIYSKWRAQKDLNDSGRRSVGPPSV